MGNYRVSRRKHSHIIVGLTAMTVLACGLDAAWASVLNSCTIYCHGMPPRDAIRKGNPHFDSQSSAFLGNHRSHLSPAPAAAECSICHASVAPANFGHENEVIAMANSLKGYSSATIRAKYDKGVFFNQTSVPDLSNATCSNVSCHFETITPVWNSPAYTAPADCNACHGFPPFGSAAAPAGGRAGSHVIHNFHYPDTNGCQKCHPGHIGFSHATSAGRPLKVQGFLRDPANTLETSGTYSGPGTNYLPSKSGSQLFGSCTNIYCHSNTGPNGTARIFGTPTWGSGPLSCDSCHADMFFIPATAPNGSHYVHASNSYAAGAKLDCAICHGPDYFSDTTHVNRLVELSFTGGGTGTTYSKPAPVTAGTAWGSCSTSLCHGAGSPAWGGSLWSTTDQCGKCHSSSAAGAITVAIPFYNTSYPTKVTSNTNAKVGAHTNHMISQSLGISASTACSDCHGTVTLTAPTHMNGSTSFAWSSLATRAGLLVPAYNPGTGQCTATYCHGNSMPGGDATGSNRSPVWNNPNYLPTTLSATACGTCHGFPPSTASGHPGGITVPAGFPASATIGTTCSCHSNINTSGNSYATMFVTPALHINGVYEPAATGHIFPYGGSLHLSAAGTTPWAGCTGCHTNTAGGIYPPVPTGTAPNCTGCHLNGLRTPSGTSSCWDCHGASAIDGKPNGNAFPNISGNHTAHVAIAGTTCATCHTGGGTGAATHGSSNRVAASPASVRVAFTGQGTSPVWTFASRTCSATNCHGRGTPTWGARIGAPVNGFPYSSVQCEKCHGATTSNPFYSNAIPKVTVNSDARVGAHFMHLTSSTLKISRAIHCNDCHSIPATVTAATHMNGTVNFTWSALATRNGALTPTYTPGTRVCANVYCHGASMPGQDTTGANRNPVWNTPFMPSTISAVACGNCHGFPPSAASGHPSLATQVPATWGNGTTAIGQACNCHSNINTSGTTYANTFVNKALHMNGVFESATGGTCVGCHAAVQTGTHGTPRDAVMAEFGLAWGHKKSGRGAVTDADCIVCHLEGDFTTQSTSAKHMDGNIDLRDPDGVGEVAITNISGTAFTFTKFAISYAAGSRTSTGHTSNSDIANVISLKFCLACHDSNGATNSTARSNNGGTGTAFMPFGGIALGSAYTAANNSIGTQGLIDVKTQTATTNASAHPIQGPRNRAYPTPARFNVPYNNFTRTPPTSSNGVVLNCFDCHNAPTVLTTRTIVSHGNAVTLRGNIWANPDTLCTICHIPNISGTTNGQHGAGSAFASGTNSGMQSYINARCEYCHASSTATPGRPIRAQDVHGFDRFAGSGTDTMWPVGATNSYKPYAFMRNTVNWTNSSWKPLSGTGVPTGSATCGGTTLSSSGCGESMTNYSPGGVYP